MRCKSSNTERITASRGSWAKRGFVARDQWAVCRWMLYLLSMARLLTETSDDFIVLQSKFFGRVIAMSARTH